MSTSPSGSESGGKFKVTSTLQDTPKVSSAVEVTRPKSTTPQDSKPKPITPQDNFVKSGGDQVKIKPVVASAGESTRTDHTQRSKSGSVTPEISRINNCTDNAKAESSNKSSGKVPNAAAQYVRQNSGNGQNRTKSQSPVPTSDGAAKSSKVKDRSSSEKGSKKESLHSNSASGEGNNKLKSQTSVSGTESNNKVKNSTQKARKGSLSAVIEKLSKGLSEPDSAVGMKSSKEVYDKIRLEILKHGSDKGTPSLSKDLGKIGRIAIKQDTGSKEKENTNTEAVSNGPQKPSAEKPAQAKNAQLSKPVDSSLPKTCSVSTSSFRIPKSSTSFNNTPVSHPNNLSRPAENGPKFSRQSSYNNRPNNHTNSNSIPPDVGPSNSYQRQASKDFERYSNNPANRKNKIDDISERLQQNSRHFLDAVCSDEAEAANNSRAGNQNRRMTPTPGSSSPRGRGHSPSHAGAPPYNRGPPNLKPVPPPALRAPVDTTPPRLSPPQTKFLPKESSSSSSSFVPPISVAVTTSCYIPSGNGSPPGIVVNVKEPAMSYYNPAEALGRKKKKDPPEGLHGQGSNVTTDRAIRHDTPPASPLMNSAMTPMANSPLLDDDDVFTTSSYTEPTVMSASVTNYHGSPSSDISSPERALVIDCGLASSKSPLTIPLERSQSPAVKPSPAAMSHHVQKPLPPPPEPPKRLWRSLNSVTPPVHSPHNRHLSPSGIEDDELMNEALTIQ